LHDILLQVEPSSNPGRRFASDLRRMRRECPGPVDVILRIAKFTARVHSAVAARSHLPIRCRPADSRRRAPMPRRIELGRVRKRVRAVATLLEDEAPRTCGAVWDAPPLEGDTYHAKWAGRELYTLVPPLGRRPVGEENATITPIPGDVCYFEVSPDTIDLPI